ncbi:MAG: hypothetical protein D6730_22965 [Bacteroidetes bacterium]|nr:MAG: hypothetical protein D6730_22965 [Bacteroidota bacterium]
MEEKEIFRGFTLVDVGRRPAQEWLAYDRPELVVMAILGEHAPEESRQLVEAILEKLQQVCQSTTDLKKFTRQLLLLSRLRKLEDVIKTYSEKMPIHIDVEKDYLFNLGVKRTEEKAKKIIAELKRQMQEQIEGLSLQKRQAEEEKRRIEAEKRQAEEEKRRIEAEKRQAEEEARRKAEAERQASILRMSDKGIVPELIAEFLGISLAEVNACLSNKEK